MTDSQSETHPFDFSEMMERTAARSTIGFVDIGEKSVGPMGSGTLMQIGSISGILTCAHVLEEINRRKDFGVVCFPAKAERFQTFKFETKNTASVVLGQHPWSANGPDIAFIKLAPADVARLAAVASVVNGALHESHCRSGEPANSDAHIDLVAGVIAEWTGPPVQDGKTITTTFQGLLNVGRVTEKRRHQELDLFDFEPVPETGFDLPKRFKGVSGGGLWRLYVQRAPGSAPVLVQARLAGVAFYETDTRHLTCHGQSSIYDHLFDRIRKEWQVV